MKASQQNFGFSLLEVLVSMGVFFSIMTLGLLFGFDFYKTYIFYSERDVLISVLQEARSKSMANINQVPYGVRLEESEYILFQGNYNNIFTESDYVYHLYPGMVLSGDIEVKFNQLSGRTDGGKIFSLSDGHRSAAIYINQEGLIDW
ncbi:MAG: hypothetical protein JNN11_01495 [Candidatus Doudnabacteria bacterium]|nr:hypothetical protein [Candidatus Doudnabacteria bacterium]